MSNLEELKSKLCPNGVEFVKLGEVCSFIYGYTEKAKDEGNVRFVRITDISEVGCLNPEGAKYINLIPECEKYLLKRGDLLTARAGATYGKTLYFDEDYPAVYASYLIKLNFDNNLILNRYYWHFTKSSYYWKQANQLAVGGAQPNLNANSLAKIILPVPPLEVQEEIVRILDPLTKDVNELIDLLKKEQELRKKQYSYYRDKLLTFDEDVPRVKLGEIGKISMCKRIMKKETNSISGIPFYKIGTFGGNPDSYISEELFKEYISKYSYPKKGDILISTSGTIGKLVIFDGLPAYFQDSNIVWIDNNEEIALNKYLYHIYKTSPWKITKGGTIARLYNGDIANTKIPLPPIEKQKEIVTILDNLEQYYNNLQESLPSEIEKRKKQYEFYRDKLLTFEKT